MFKPPKSLSKINRNKKKARKTKERRHAKRAIERAAAIFRESLPLPGVRPLASSTPAEHRSYVPESAFDWSGPLYSPTPRSELAVPRLENTEDLLLELGTLAYEDPSPRLHLTPPRPTPSSDVALPPANQAGNLPSLAPPLAPGSAELLRVDLDLSQDSRDDCLDLHPDLSVDENSENEAPPPAPRATIGVPPSSRGRVRLQHPPAFIPQRGIPAPTLPDFSLPIRRPTRPCNPDVHIREDKLHIRHGRTPTRRPPKPLMGINEARLRRIVNRIRNQRRP